MIYRYRGPHSGIKDVEGGRERGVWKYLRRDHGWSEQFPENISIILMVIIYSNVDDGDDDDNYEVDNMMMIDMIIMLMTMVMMARTCSR